MNYNFDFCLSIGATVEELVKEHLAARGHNIIDVTQDKEYQTKDIDFLLDNGNEKTTLEVKLDSKISRNGNFFFEEGFDRKSGFRKGWFRYCEADYICFYDSSIATGYILDFAKAREVVKEQGNQMHWFNNTDNCTGYAYLLPVGVARENDLIVYEWRNS